MKKKYIRIRKIIAVCSLLALCIIILRFQFSQTNHKEPVLYVSKTPPIIATEDTSSWKKYTDNTLHATVLVPNNWYPHELEELGGHSLFISAPIDTKIAQAPRDGQHLAISIIREDNSVNKSIENWGLEFLTDPNNYLGPADRYYITIDGKKAIQLKFIDEKRYTLTAVNVGKYRYIISVTALDVQYATYEGLINLFITSLELGN